MTQEPENHHDGLLVGQAILAKTTVFTSYSKKEKWPKHTALVDFSKIKSFHSQNTVLSSFGKKLTPLGTIQKIHECLLKEALSPFLVLLSKAERHTHTSENPNIWAYFRLKLFYQCSNSKNKCLGLQMARMEMDCILKK